MKLKIGASQRTMACATWYIAVCAERRGALSAPVVYEPILDDVQIKAAEFDHAEIVDLLVDVVKFVVADTPSPHRSASANALAMTH